MEADGDTDDEEEGALSTNDFRSRSRRRVRAINRRVARARRRRFGRRRRHRRPTTTKATTTTTKALDDEDASGEWTGRRRCRVANGPGDEDALLLRVDRIAADSLISDLIQESILNSIQYCFIEDFDKINK